VSDIGWTGLLISLLLVAVAIGLSLRSRLGLEPSLAWAATRAMAQLLAVGLLLKVLLEPDVSYWWAFLWVAAMILIAAWTVRQRAGVIPGVFELALAAFAASSVVTLGVLFGFGVFEPHVRTIVPLSGIMLGNSLGATVLVARRLIDEFRDKREEVEARLALGQHASEAAHSYVRNALRTALIPQIVSRKAVGLIALPGSMTGLILAGVDPLDAVRVQAAVMYLILGSAATTTTVMSLGIQRRLFTRDHRLVPLGTPAPAPARGAPARPRDG
jgi:putative ABC transport system permease protein